MSKDIQWSDWKVHTGGECPFDEGIKWQATFCDGSGPATLKGFVDAASDYPLTYRHEVKPREVQPFAVVFKGDGAACALWSSIDGADWRENSIGQSTIYGRYVIFYGPDGHPTGERHDFTEAAL